MNHSFRSLFLYLIVLATGAAGLVYQVVWQRYLSRLLGNDSMATAIILATFLGGLSLGYFLCGRLTTRVRNHFKGYAVLEGIIALWCLGFPTLFATVDALTAGWRFSPPFWIVLQGVFCSAVLIGPPTVCMGGTIPFLTRGISTSVVEATRVHARVYAVNTAGAFLGALAAGFFLIPHFGLPLTVMGGAFVNLAAFLFFYFVPLSSPRPRDESPEETAPYAAPAGGPAAPAYPPRSLYVIAFFSGFYVMTLENVFIRLTNLSLGSSSYAFSMIVSVFVLCIAVGSWAVGRMERLPRSLLFVNQAAITILLLAVYLSLDWWPYAAHLIRISFRGNISGFWLYYAAVFAALFLVLALPVGFMGATVPIGFHELKRDLKSVGRHSGYLFSWNTIGNLTGSLIGGMAFYYLMNNDRAFAAAILLAAVSAILAGWHWSRKTLILSLPLTVLPVLVIVFTPFYTTTNFTRETFRIRSPLPHSYDGPARFFSQSFAPAKIRYYNDGPSAMVAVKETAEPSHPTGKNLAILVNGKSDSATAADAHTLKLMAHIPALLAEKRRSVLVIGLGTGVTAGEMSLYPEIKRIDAAEISPSVAEILPLFGEFTYNVHQDPRLKIHIGDAFRILGRSREKWDIIISEPSNPWVTGVDLLFTQKFYHLAREHLSDSGVLLQWIHFYAADIRMLGMVLNTIGTEFSHIRVFMSNIGDLLILASNRPVSQADLERAGQTWETNHRVRASLSEIKAESLDSILLREIWTPPMVAEAFSGYGVQTMDNPRLHYLAGKMFFMGAFVGREHIFSSSSAPYFRTFLAARKYPAWDRMPFDKPTFESLWPTLTGETSGKLLPMAGALKLKAYLADPAAFPLSEKEARDNKTGLLPLIIRGGHGEESWDKAGLGESSLRERAETLLHLEARTRNWIAPYPLDGLYGLLKNGITQSRDPRDKNWYTLTLTKLLKKEKAPNALIEKAFQQAVRGKDGRIQVHDRDRGLLAEVEGWMR